MFRSYRNFSAAPWPCCVTNETSQAVHTTADTSQPASRTASTASTFMRHRDDAINGWRFSPFPPSTPSGGGFLRKINAPSHLHMATPIHPSPTTPIHLPLPLAQIQPMHERDQPFNSTMPGDWGPPSNVEQRSLSTLATRPMKLVGEGRAVCF